MYVRINNRFGEVTPLQPGSSFSFVDRFRELVGSGRDLLALSLALNQGIRSESELTSLIFNARHPERGGRRIARDESQFQQLSKEWIGIRDQIVRPALRRLAGGVSLPEKAKPGVQKISATTVSNISTFDHLIDPIATQHKVDPNIVRGIIAAESNGNPNSGKENAQGYKGLMQAGTGVEQLDPETSIRSGVVHFINKRTVVVGLLKSLRVNVDSIDPDTMVNYVMTAYNAGEGTLKKALQYAKAAGDMNKWDQAEHFQRALFFTGAYSVRAPLKWCFGRLTPTLAAKALSDLTGVSADQLMRDYFRPSNGWDVNRIRKAFGSVVINKLAAENKKLRKNDSLLIEKAREVASPLLMCAVEFKHTHRVPYVEKVLRYKRYFDATRRSAN